VAVEVRQGGKLQVAVARLQAEGTHRVALAAAGEPSLAAVAEEAFLAAAGEPFQAVAEQHLAENTHLAVVVLVLLG